MTAMKGIMNESQARICTYYEIWVDLGGPLICFVSSMESLLWS